MHIILLSGGSGKRLWPLSNGTRSKQFLKLLTAPDGTKESMIQRMTRQISEAQLDADITIATSESQKDAILSQLAHSVKIVTEPERRDTFPAIALSCAYLLFEEKVREDDVVVVMPCDSFVDITYFEAIKEVANRVNENQADLILIGISPTEASTKYGYLLPEKHYSSNVKSFFEKPDASKALELIDAGAVWNGGVFGFRLGYLKKIFEKYVSVDSFHEFKLRYSYLPKISFDYEVAENATSVGVVYYNGRWMDLGTWDTLSNELADNTIGNCISINSDSTTVINELNIPLVCHCASGLIVAASPDGVLVASKTSSDTLKNTVQRIESRPMFEERRWGCYRVIDNVEFKDGFCALTKQLSLNPGCSISYQRHKCRDEVWIFIDGEGEIVVNGVRKKVSRGDTVTIYKTQLHALKAITPLTFIEVQRGNHLVEDDIERFEYEW